MAAVNIPQQYQTLKTRLERVVKKIISPKLINANDDLNDYLENGYYYCNLPDSDIATISNCPVSAGFTLFVEQNYCYDNGVKQIVTQHQSSATYMRVIYTDWNNNFYSSGWKPLWEDTGWKTVSFSSGYSNHSSYHTVYRRVGKVVHLKGAFTNSNALTSSNTDVQWGSISDTSCRPSNQELFLQQGSGANKYVLGITTDGKLTWARYGTNAINTSINKGAWFVCYATWLVD